MEFLIPERIILCLQWCFISSYSHRILDVETSFDDDSSVYTCLSKGFWSRMSTYFVSLDCLIAVIIIVLLRITATWDRIQIIICTASSSTTDIIFIRASIRPPFSPPTGTNGPLQFCCMKSLFLLSSCRIHPGRQWVGSLRKQALIRRLKPLCLLGI